MIGETEGVARRASSDGGPTATETDIAAALGLRSEDLRRLHRLDRRRATGRLLLAVSVYAAASGAGAVWPHPLVLLAQWVVQGIVLAGLLCAAHFCIHGTLWGRPVDRVVGAVFGAVLLVNFSVFRAYHLEHHRTTGTDQDPQPPRIFRGLGAYLLRMVELRFVAKFAGWSFDSLRNRYPAFVRKAADRKAIRADALLQLAWVAIAIGLTAVAPGPMARNYWVPWLFFVPSIFMVTVAEHYGCEKGTDVYRNTRTLDAPLLLRWLLWDINFHGEHHVFPRMPGWSLAQLPRQLHERFVYRQPSYWAFHLWACRGLWAGRRAAPGSRP